MMFNKPKKEKNTYGIVGLGRFGYALAMELAASDADILVLDKDEEKVREMREYTESAYVMKTLDKKSLAETGIQNCGTVTICIGEALDVSILTTMLVIRMGIPNVISKANSQEHGEVLKQLGAMVVYPESDMAVRIGKRLISGSLIDYISLDDNVEVRRIAVGGAMVGHSILELNIRNAYGINVIAVERDHQTDVEFPPQYVFREGDIVAVIGKEDKIDHFEREMQNNG